MEFSGKLDLGGRELTLRSGRLAKQADGAVEVLYGDTVVLSTACIDDPKDLPFFPLTVEYQEMAYSAGKIPGGFFKREGKPSNLETVAARLTDRPIRPMFPDDYRNEVQVISTVFSAESRNLPDVMSIVGASAALMIADCPFDGPLGAVRVGRVDGELLINPSHEQVEEGDLDLVVAGTDEEITMVEASAGEVDESVLLDGMELAHDNIQEIIDLQRALVKQCQSPQSEYTTPDTDEDVARQIEDEEDRIREALFVPDKQDREEALGRVEDQLEEEILGDLQEEYDNPALIEAAEFTFENKFDEVQKKLLKEAIFEDGQRIDGRGLDEVRPINVEVGHLPRTHGSGLFTRGETQALATVTLGTPSETQRIDNIYEEAEKRFLLHYNFPPFCVGECRRMTGPGRREIGHGLMAESAIRSVLPDEEDWPYTTRVVSEILESNGSSSMATICAGSMALMDAGVPLERPVSGVSMGLVERDGEYRILTDILGDEDHMGDMDFKVAGTREGVTSLQLDMKISGIPREILEEAMDRAQDARFQILETMSEAISEPSESISEHAPRLYTLEIPKDKIRDLIGPGGKNIKKIINETGASVDVEDDGTVFIGAENEEAGEEARKRVEQYTQEVQVGETYEGEVVNTTDFGAFVEILPGQEGLVHISELSDEHVNQTTDVVEEGDIITVKCTDITDKGIELSKREADKEKEEATAGA
jgi:polyribonucleotide nucleotidyltransferase